MPRFTRSAWRRLATAALLSSTAFAPAWAETEETTTARAEDSSNITVYEPAFFARFKPNTAMDMVRRLPGFSFDGGSGARGFSGTGGNVLIDGQRPPSRGDSLSSVISRIPAGGVTRIEIIHGGADGIDMQGLPIIANIVRKADAGLAGSMNGNLNFSETGDLAGYVSLQVSNQTGGQLIEGALSYNNDDNSSDSRRWRLAPDGGVLLVGDRTGKSRFERIGITGAWETDRLGGSLRINGLAGHQTFADSSEDVLVIPGGSEIRVGEEQETGVEAGVRYARTIAGGYGLEIVGFQSFESETGEGVFNTPDFSSGGQEKSEAGESIARASMRLPATGDWVIDGGGETVLNFQESTEARSFNGQPFELDGDTNRVEELRAEAFGTATWTPFENLSVESALRYEWSRIDAVVGDVTSEKTLKYLKPRLNISWSPAEGHQWGAQIERVVEQLSFGSFASDAAFETEVFGVGNPDIEPQKLWVFDARYERQFGGQNSFVAQFIHTEIEDFLGRTVIVVPATPDDPQRILQITRNVGTASRHALELDGTFELDRFGIDGGIFALGVELRDSRVTDPVTGEERLLSGQDPWAWNMSVQQTLANGDFRWSIFLEDNADSVDWSPQRVSEGHGGPFVGINMSWKPALGWTLGASANNLVAEDGSTESIFYDAPRNVGQPLYTEYRTNEARRRFSVSVRRDF